MKIEATDSNLIEAIRYQLLVRLNRGTPRGLIARDAARFAVAHNLPVTALVEGLIQLQ